VKVFVSGVAGFIGSQLARHAITEGWTVTGIDSMLSGDEANVPAEARWMRSTCQAVTHYRQFLRDADVVVHCAAAPYEGLSVFSPQLVYEHTLMSTVALVRASIAAGVKRFVFCSSMSRYGAQGVPFREEMDTAPVDPYGCAKVAAEEAVKTICRLHGLEWVIVVPHNVYGPGQKYWDPYRNVAAIMINRVLSGKPPIIYGDGYQRRCLSYIGDVVPALAQACTSRYAHGEVFNLGPSGDGETITDLATLILDVTGSDLEPQYMPPRPAEVHFATCDCSKSAAMLGYEPTWDLRDGLEKLAAWIGERGPRPFTYHLPIELPTDQTPRTWTERLM
jgi:UDP-glucose 4-epimerase